MDRCGQPRDAPRYILGSEGDDAGVDRPADGTIAQSGPVACGEERALKSPGPRSGRPPSAETVDADAREG